MSITPREKNIRTIFIMSIIFKGIMAIFEIVGGVLLLFSGTISTFIINVANAQLLEDPNQFLAHTILQHMPYFSEHSQWFAAFYLLSHGIIKIPFLIGLLQNKLWAYPFAIAVFIIFIFYQVYRYSYTHSTFLIVLTIWDLVVIWLTWHEYKQAHNIVITTQ